MTIRTPSFRRELTAGEFNRRSTGHLPGLAGVEILNLAPAAVRSRMAVRREVMAPNGFLHAPSPLGHRARRHELRLRLRRPPAAGRERLHHRGAEGELRRHGARRGDRLPGDARPPRAHDPGVGRRGDPRRHRNEDRALPLHPNAVVAEIGLWFNASGDAPVLRFLRVWILLFPLPAGGGARLTSTQHRTPKNRQKSLAFFFCQGEPMPRPAEPYVPAVPMDRTSLTDDERIDNIVPLPPPEHLIRFFPIQGTILSMRSSS